jgi:hypothetical protein
MLWNIEKQRYKQYVFQEHVNLRDLKKRKRNAYVQKNAINQKWW